MNNIHVLLVGDQSLLGDALEKLLAANDQLCLYRVSVPDYQRLLAHIYGREPVVIIVEWEAFGGEIAELVQLLQDYYGLQIIIVSSESNKIQVYACYETRLPSVGDLTTLILETARPAPKFRHRYAPVSLSEQLFSLSGIPRRPR
jgi:hypothetical protein